METPDILNSKSLKVFIKGTLVLIGLFFALSCGVAALLICFGKNIECNVFALILILIILPLIIFLTVFLRFSCLVKSYYESSSIKEKEFSLREEFILKKDIIKIIGEMCNTSAKSIKSDCEKNEKILEEIKDILKQFLEKSSGDKKS